LHDYENQIAKQTEKYVSFFKADEGNYSVCKKTADAIIISTQTSGELFIQELKAKQCGNPVLKIHNGQ